MSSVPHGPERLTDRAFAAHAQGYRVRPATADDAPAMARVHAEVWRQTYTGLMRPEVLDGLDVEANTCRWRDFLTTGSEAGPTTSTPWVGLAPHGCLVGLGSAGPGRDEDAPAPVELWAINILGPEHGTGLADLMLANLIGEADAYLWVVQGNDRAVSFYRRHGFVPDIRRPDEEYGTTDIRMVRVVNAGGVDAGGVDAAHG